MHFLLTNDDGIDAEGLAALEAAARNHGDRISIVAPATEMSMVGHRITCHHPVKVEERGERQWAIHGTPADCARIGLHALLTDDPPDVVLSGINHGGNLGHDIYISGTVAAAREAAYHGVPAMAFSHYLRGDITTDWTVASRRISALLPDLLTSPLGDGEIWNVNLPPLPADAAEPEVVTTKPERRPLESRFHHDADANSYLYTGNYQARPHSEGSDVAVCFGGAISVSKIAL